MAGYAGILRLMFTTRPEIIGTFGAVASTHWLASQVAMAVLEQGGNAFDAAVAAGFMLQVAEPHLNGPGGDVPILIHCAATDSQHVICGQGVSPAAASLSHFESLGLDLVPGTGLLPAVVPGAFDAWCLMLRDWGTWELRDVLSYAISYARNGVPLVANACSAIESVRPLFETEWPTSAAVFLPHGRTPKPGELFANRTMAETFDRLANSSGRSREGRIDSAREAWYRGFVAESIGCFFESHVIMDASGARHRGLLTADDLAGWSATIEAPVRYDYHGYEILKCGPWSQGPVFLQQLALLRDSEISALDPLGADFVHLVTECAKFAFADREAFYGDPNFVEVPVTTLLSREYNTERRRLVSPQASMVLRPGNPHGSPPKLATVGKALPNAPMALGVGEPTVAHLGVKPGDTCHVDVVDRWGNLVSATPSAGWLQSSPVIPDLGFPMGNRGQMFWLEEGLPSSIGPKRRPRTTLSPSMSLRDGSAWMAFGTPGGDQQDQWSLIFFLRLVHQRQNLQQAIDAPSFHSEHWRSSFWPRRSHPAKLVLEGRFPESTIISLKARGHEVEIGGAWTEGRLSAVQIESERVLAGANPRGMQGYAVGR
jgi:gamma-glutamyltranspeptidase/glutathione hydrolase